MERNGLPHVALDGFSVDVAQTLDYICVCRCWDRRRAACSSSRAPYSSNLRRSLRTVNKASASLEFMHGAVDLHVKFHRSFLFCCCCISPTRRLPPRPPPLFAEPKSSGAQSETHFLLKPPTLPADCCTAAPELQL